MKYYDFDIKTDRINKIGEYLKRHFPSNFPLTAVLRAQIEMGARDAAVASSVHQAAPATLQAISKRK